MKSVRKVENIHIFLWLLKDSCWVMDFQKLGVFMILPTVVVAFLITYRARKIKTDLFHNIAVCCWVLANSVWMIGEFFYDDTTRPYATVFFVSGVLVMSYYYLFLHFRKDNVIEETEDDGNVAAVKPAVLESVD